MKKFLSSNIFLSILSGLILCIGWTQLCIGWCIFIAFVPLLAIMERLIADSKKRKATRFFGFSCITIFIWNAISTWWIMHSTIPGAIAAIAISTLLMALVMPVSFYSFKAFGRRIGYVAFVVNWIAFEYLFMNSQISWPWLVLGNSFSNNISLIQWYEYVGHLGGSTWIIVINVLTYELIRQIYLKSSKVKIRNYSIGLACLIFIPMIFSIVRYNTYEDQGVDTDIVVIQPNIDPWNDKFDNLSVFDQLNTILNEGGKIADANVDYFVAPETAIPNGIWEEEINSNSSIKYIKTFLSNFPDSKFIIGASTLKYYIEGDDIPITVRKFKGSENEYYDAFNTSLQIDTSENIYIYHKSMLVPGVEMMPYPKIFGFLQDIMIDLGGMTGSLGKQDYRTVFPNEKLNIKAGAPICYESAYGEFTGQFIQEGADLLFVITNDGWWKNTPGHKQHKNFSKIRAVETRKSIARSANTGISCFINQRGDILQELGWWQRGALRETLKANNKITFYTKYGDFVPRMALVFALILLAILIINGLLLRIKKK